MLRDGGQLLSLVAPHDLRAKFGPRLESLRQLRLGWVDGSGLTRVEQGADVALGKGVDGVIAAPRKFAQPRAKFVGNLKIGSRVRHRSSDCSTTV